MKKLILAVMVLGLLALAISPAPAGADSTRTIAHKFKAITANEVVSAQGAVLFKISGVATGSPGVYGIYNSSTLGGTTEAVCAVEGGEATSGDPVPNVDFGPEGLVLNAGLTVVVSNCTVVIEWL